MTREDQDERDRLLYELPTNVVVAAGAGTGKTHRLSGLYVHLVAGLTEVTRRDGTLGPLAPDAIVATTFTREAASEMRSRIEARLRLLCAWSIDDLARGAAGDAAAAWADELRRTSDRRKVQAPDRAVFRAALDGLPRATITTFHSWAGELVRTNPIEARVPPGFGLLEPEESDALVARATTTVATAWIDDESSPQVVGAGAVTRARAMRKLLVSGMDVLRDAVRKGLARAAEEGVDEGALELADTEEQIADARGQRRALVDALAEAVARRRATKAPPRELDEALLVVRAGVAALERGSSTSEPARNDRATIASAVKTIHASLGGGALAEVKGAVDALLGSRGTIEERAASLVDEPERTGEARALELAARAFLVEVAAKVSESKRRRRVLDFGDVLRRARDLLRDHPDVQAELATDVRALLVDEFQDTNALQRDLVYLARQAPRAIARRAAGVLPDPATLSPTGLFLVGDRKQSIYSFRGADVSVFQQIAVDLAGDDARALLGVRADGAASAGSGRVVSLDENRRSVDEVLRFVNAVASADMRGHDALASVEQVVFQPELEALRAVRVSGLEPSGTNPRVIVPTIDVTGCSGLDVSGDLLAALGIAAELRALLADPSIAKLQAPLRRRDIAILIRSYSILPALEFALSLHRVEHAVAAGRGLFATAEARDIEALVRLALDRHDRHALLGVLRGPLVSLSDRALLSLASEHGLELPRDEAISITENGLDDGELRRLTVLRRALEELGEHGERLPPGIALGRALARLRYEPTLALLPGGEARIRDARRILELADGFSTGLAAVARWLARGRQGDLDEARGAIFDDEHDAVRVLTIHASKGLEFRVVVAMQLDHVGPSSIQGPLVVARGGRGLSLAVRIDRDGARDFGRGGRTLHDRAIALERAERQRLTYVALTRARDLLYAVARPSERTDPYSAATSVAKVLESRPDLASRKVLQPFAEPAPEPARAAELPPVRAYGEGPLRAGYAGSLVVTTALADFAACPRRFRLLHLVGVPEHAPRARPFDDDEPVSVEAVAIATDAERDETRDATPVGPLPVDPRARGVLAHLALERAPLETATGDGAVEYARAFLRTEGFDPDDEGGRGVVERIARFLGSSYGRTLAPHVSVATTGASVEVLREHPFVIELPSGIRLRGTIDLVVVRKREGRMRVEIVDYKSGKGTARDVEHYALQLRAYAAACTHGALGHRVAPAREGPEVVAGIAFLGGSGDPLWLDDGRDLASGTTAAAIDEVARRLLDARLGGEWPGIAEPRCAALRCGFAPLCHPRESSPPPLP